MTGKRRPEPGGELILFTTEEGRIRIEPRLDGGTAWLSAAQLGELFERDKSVIAKHIRAIYDTGELSREATSARFAEVRTEGSRAARRTFEYFDLDVVLAPKSAKKGKD